MNEAERQKFDKWLSDFASSFAGHCTDEAIFMAEEAWQAARASESSPPQPDETLQRIREILFSAMEMKESSLEQCDRSALELAMIASNAIFWRQREIDKLRGAAATAPSALADKTTTSTAEDRYLACSTDESCSEDGVMATQIGTGKPIAAQVVGGKAAPSTPVSSFMPQITRAVQRVAESSREDDTCQLSKEACQTLMRYFSIVGGKTAPSAPPTEEVKLLRDNLAKMTTANLIDWIAALAHAGKEDWGFLKTEILTRIEEILCD